MPMFPTNQFYDLSPLIETTPYIESVVESLNLFSTEYERSNRIAVRRWVNDKHLVSSRERQGERNFIQDKDYTEKAFLVPFFPVDSKVNAVDVQNFKDLLNMGADTPATVAQAVQRKLNIIRRAEASTKERIFIDAIKGRSYAGVDTINTDQYYDYYAEWGQTQEDIAVDFTSTTINPMDVIENEIRASIIDKKGNGTRFTDMVALVGRGYFQSVVSNNFTRQAFNAIPGANNPLRDRVGGNVDARSWEFGGVLYVEDLSGAVATNEAYFFPRGIDNMFQSFYAPADTTEAANTIAQDFYMYMIEDHRKVKIETEFSLLAVNTRPELVVHSTVA